MTELTGTERLFLAVALPPEAREALRRHLQGTALPGRPVPPENWHLTLRFLGQVAGARRRALGAALSATHLGTAFTVSLRGAGAFPRPDRATVLWIGVGDGGRLAELAAAAERAARAAGFRAEDRPFRPHLTVSRLRAPGSVAPLLQRIAPAGIESLVDALVLFRSHPGHGPPTYQAVARWPLR